MTEFEIRRARLSERVAEKKLDALVVTGAPNVRYLTGFTGGNSVLLVMARGTTLFTDPRYQIQAGAETTCRVRVVRGPLLGRLIAVARRRRVRRLGFEKNRISYAAYQLLYESLWLGATMEPMDGLVEGLRTVKSAAEIEAIRRSMLISAGAFEKGIRKARPGMLERDLAAELDHQMRRAGAEGPAFETIVAAGNRSALPHARPGDRALRAGDLILVDMGASAAGYASDMTRTLVLGRPARKVQRLYAAVLEAQLAAIGAVRAGVEAQAVDRAARRVLGAHGLARHFTHSTGHGLGLEIHEAPRLGRRERTRLEAGMVVTVEPGVYLEGFGGVRIEDTVVVRPNGCEILTPNSKQLRTL